MRMKYKDQGRENRKRQGGEYTFIGDLLWASYRNRCCNTHNSVSFHPILVGGQLRLG